MALRVRVVLLALAAGGVDAVGFLTLFNVFTAHLSGDTTRLAVDLGSGDLNADALAVALVLITFVCGIFIGVYLVAANETRRRLLIAVEIACLVVLTTIGTITLDRGELHHGGFFFYLLVVLAALAMGLQTAYLRRTAGTSVHTTFITGMLTALAEDTVTWCRDRTDVEARRRISIHGCIWLGYLTGGIVGAALALEIDFWALALPITLLAVVALGEFTSRAPPVQPGSLS